MGATPVRVQRLGRIGYATALERMRAFTASRHADTPDEIWLLEHPPVYTLGVRARRRLLPPSRVPVTVTDRGGDVTYHGPGQPVIYVLIDLVRRALGIQSLVWALEQAVIEVLADFEISAERHDRAPGVYVSGRKIASLGLRVRAGRTYHGLAFNARMDLAPFHAIDPCGYPGLRMAQLAEWRPEIDSVQAGEQLLRQVLRGLGYTEDSPQPGNTSEPAPPFDARR